MPDEIIAQSVDATPTAGADELTASQNSDSAHSPDYLRLMCAKLSAELKSAAAFETLNFSASIGRPVDYRFAYSWWRQQRSRMMKKLSNNTSNSELGTGEVPYNPEESWEETLIIHKIWSSLHRLRPPPINYSSDVRYMIHDELEREHPSWTEGIDEDDVDKRYRVSILTELSPYTQSCVHKGTTVNSEDQRLIHLPTCIAQAVSRDVYDTYKDRDDMKVHRINLEMEKMVTDYYEAVQRGEHTCKTLQTHADVSGDRTGVPMKWNSTPDGRQTVTLLHNRAKDVENPALLPELELKFEGITTREHDEMLRSQDPEHTSEFHPVSVASLENYWISMRDAVDNGILVKDKDGDCWLKEGDVYLPWNYEKMDLQCISGQGASA